MTPNYLVNYYLSHTLHDCLQYIVQMIPRDSKYFTYIYNIAIILRRLKNKLLYFIKSYLRESTKRTKYRYSPRH